MRGMIICVCKAVSDKHIRAAVADGITSMRELTRELRIGTCCGRCLPEAKAALAGCIAQSAGHAQQGVGVSAPAFCPAPAAEFAA